MIVAVPAGLQTDDVMIAQIAVRGGNGTAITAPAGWSLVRRDNNSTTITQALYVRVAGSPASEPASYTWNFTNGNDAAGGIAAYAGVNITTPVDVSGGQANARSTSLTAPSVTVAAGHNTDRLVGLFALPNSSTVTGPSGMTQRWSFHATGGGIGIEMSDLALASAGTTGNKVAHAGTAGVNLGQQVALLPADEIAATPTPSNTPTLSPTASRTPSPTASPTRTPTATASPTPVPTNTPTASPSLTPTTSPTPSPTPAVPSPTPSAATIVLRSTATGSTSATSNHVTINGPRVCRATT